jgi:CRP-like cAMP-binding protein
MQAKAAAIGEARRSLAAISLLEGLDQAALTALAGRCRWSMHPRGGRVIERGSASRDVLFVVEGSVDIVDRLPSGRDIVYATVGAGEHLGELAAVDGEPRSASAVAAEPTLIAAMPTHVFLDLLRQNGEVALRLLRRLARMVRSGDVRILELASLAASQRICAELLRRARPDDGAAGLWIVQPLPPLRVIAGCAGTTRETVARTLARLYGDGVASRQGRRLLLDRAGLECRIEGLTLPDV